MTMPDMSITPADPGLPVDEVQFLADLDTRLIDTIRGLETVQEKAERSFLPVAGAFHQLHERQRATLARMLLARGHDPDANGSILGTVNSVVVTVRSWFDNIDAGILESLIDGEQHVLDAYDAAIENLRDPGDRAVLTQDRDALRALLKTHATGGD